MDPASLKSLSQKVVLNGYHNIEKGGLEKMLKKDLSTEDYNRLKENTLLTLIRERLEQKEEYIFFRKFLKEREEYYDDVRFHHIEDCALDGDEYSRETLKLVLDDEIRKEMIGNEMEKKKYLKRNGFDALKGARQFLIKLDTFLNNKFSKEDIEYTLKEMVDSKWRINLSPE